MTFPTRRLTRLRSGTAVLSSEMQVVSRPGCFDSCHVLATQSLDLPPGQVAEAAVSW